MEEYIYKPPPPPPSKVASSNPKPPDKTHPNRPAPYNKDNTGKRGGRHNQHDFSGGSLEIVDEALAERVKLEATDIDAWIASRKRNWPSDKRIKEKEEDLEKKRREKQRQQELSAGSTEQEEVQLGPVHKPKRYEPPPTNRSLFKSLVQNDLDKEDESVLQFINYLYDKGII